ncbi:MAG: hypothetical protein K0R39_879 [Symbiobacteriaceae bacterium]|jgi:hypothetical protein|nr:hypothetical protein [Symbiobacteriaceae bacterium]
MTANERAITNRFTEAQDRLVLQAADLSLETIAAMVDKESIDIEPEFQRRERWSPDQQSALIESFLLNVPVPPVYLAEDDFGTYSVIDGKQRITTIRDFMRNDLVLGSLEAFPDITGMRFRDLPRPLRNALEVRPYLRVVTLLKQSDPKLKYEVFTRLNRGGQPLNAQEIRNVAFRGGLNDLIYKLAENEFLCQQLKIRNLNAPAYREMYDAEYVLRFLTLHATWQKFTGSLRKSMDEFMSENREPSDERLEELRSKFEHSITACRRIWDELAFKRPTSDAWRHQMLAGMYDAQMLAVADLPADRVDRLANHSDEVIERTRKLFTEDPEFEESVRRATNTPSRIVYRITTMRELLESIG